MATTPTASLQYLTASLGGPVPLCYGHVRAVGNNIILQENFDKSRTAFYVLGEGEWDGIDRLWVNNKLLTLPSSEVHFHPGLDGTLGAGLAATSTGGDQKADAFFTLLPGGIQPLGFSRRAYISLSVPPDSGAPTPQLTVIGDYRTTKVRQFDAAGTQTAYAFSTNPAWCILDAIFRFVLKRESMINEAVSIAEAARINWASFYAAAQYYDFDITLGGANGPIKRFEINVAFPQQITVTALIEQLLLMSRSYLIEEDGVLYLFPDQARASTFTLTTDHYIPGTLQADEKSVRASANHFVGKCNDLNPTIVSTVGVGGAVRLSNLVTLTTTGAHPFLQGDWINLFGFLDPSFDGTFQVRSVPSSTTLTFNQLGANTTSGTGSIGTNESLYATRTPIVDHAQHQLAIGQRGVGLSAISKKIELDLDYGNNTAERVRRLLAYQKVRSLGPDVVPYKAPWTVHLKARAESIDGAGNALMAQLRGDIITIDHSVSEELAGLQFEIIEVDFTPPSGNTGDPSNGGSSVPQAVQKFAASSASFNSQESGLLDLTLTQYMPAAFTDNIDAVPSLNASTTSGGVKAFGGAANGAYQLYFQSLGTKIVAHDAGTSVTITVPALVGAFPGISPNPAWAGGSVINAGYGTRYFLWLVDADLRGGSPQIQVSTDSSAMLATPGAIFIDTLITPLAGAPDRYGDGAVGTGPIRQQRQVTFGIAGGLPAGTFIFDALVGFGANSGVEPGMHVILHPVLPMAAGWAQVSWVAWSSAEDFLTLRLNNPNGTAVTLAQQNFEVLVF